MIAADFPHESRAVETDGYELDQSVTYGANGELAGRRCKRVDSASAGEHLSSEDPGGFQLGVV